MSRACLHNARFLANVDSPLLPLLAPRAFAEPPFVQNNSRQHDETAQKMQETETRYRRGRRAFAASTSRHALNACFRRGYSSNTPTALQASLVPEHITRGSRQSLAMRYIHIYAFTRTQLRGYSTAKSPAIVQPKKASPRHASLRKKPNPQRIRRVNNTHYKILLERRRFRLQCRVKKRIDGFMSHRNPNYSGSWTLDGRYRSLARRLFALRRKDITCINLAQQKMDGWSNIKVFAALDRRLYAKARRVTAKITLEHDPRCSQWATNLFLDAGVNDEEQIAKRWLDTDEGIRKAYWPHLLIYLLDRMPGKSLLFLRLLILDPLNSPRKASILADALGHLAKIHAGWLYVRKSWTGSVEWNRERFVPTFCRIFQGQLASRRSICTQELFVNIARVASIEDLKIVFDLFVKYKTIIAYDTLLTYANAFAYAGESKYALDCLRHLVANSQTDKSRLELVNRKRFRWSCALITRKSMTEEQHHDTADIIAAVVEFGVKLDTLLYNVIINNTIQMGDHTTAFAVFNNLSDNNLKPDVHTLSILLHGCAMADDPAKFHYFAERCKETAKKLRDSGLATDYLYYIYRRHLQDLKFPESRGTHLLCRAYQELFSQAPLYPLWDLKELSHPSTSETPKGSGFEPLEPSHVAIYIMVQMRIQIVANMGHTSLWNLFLTFKGLVSAGYHPAIHRLARDPTIWNAFLLAFCKAQQFESASRLIKYMTDTSPRPNVYTWNIFMQSFSKKAQSRATERVYGLMRSADVEPDQFTYGLLLKLYLRTQNFERITAVMEHMDVEQQMDPELLDRMARVHDRDKLMKAIEDAGKRREYRRTLEKREARARMLEKWSLPPTFVPLLASASNSSSLGLTQNHKSQNSRESPEADEHRSEEVSQQRQSRN